MAHTELDDQTAEAERQYRITENLRARDMTDANRYRFEQAERRLHALLAALTPPQFLAYARATVAWDEERNAADKAANG